MAARRQRLCRAAWRSEERPTQVLPGVSLRTPSPVLLVPLVRHATTIIVVVIIVFDVPSGSSSRKRRRSFGRRRSMTAMYAARRASSTPARNLRAQAMRATGWLAALRCAAAVAMCGRRHGTAQHALTGGAAQACSAATRFALPSQPPSLLAHVHVHASRIPRPAPRSPACSRCSLARARAINPLVPRACAQLIHRHPSSRLRLASNSTPSCAEFEFNAKSNRCLRRVNATLRDAAGPLAGCVRGGWVACVRARVWVAFGLGASISHSWSTLTGRRRVLRALALPHRYPRQPLLQSPVP